MPAREDFEQRALRILAAAGELVLRWGYDKTTVDDVARAAGVAKGTIYLHWKTREDLFIALVRHERLGVATDIRAGIDDDPYGVTPAGVVRQLGLSMQRRPLVKAFVLRDEGVVGKLLRQIGAGERKAIQRDTLVGYLTEMRKHRGVRADLAVAAQANIVVSMVAGFFLVEPMLLDEGGEVPDLMAETVHRTLAPDREPSAAGWRRCERATRAYIDEVVAQSGDKFTSSMAGGRA